MLNVALFKPQYVLPIAMVALNMNPKQNSSCEDDAQQPPSREHCVKLLKSGEEFDLLIVGGGATGMRIKRI